LSPPKACDRLDLDELVKGLNLDRNVNFERIWAPWRLEDILGEDDEKKAEEPRPLPPGGQDGCFLCHCVAEGDDRGQLVVHRGERTLTVLNRYPYNNGHLLVAPRRHVARLEDLTADEHLELAQGLARMVGLLEKVMHPDGFNVGLNLGRVAGAGLPGHLHWHIVPRWSGDTNFMPVVAGTRVIPQSLDALWEALHGE
jgi:ATP adenylyltransferase